MTTTSAAPTVSLTLVKALLAYLSGKGRALLWRRDHWLVLGPEHAQHKKLPRKFGPCVQQAIALGQLVVGEDGAFRPQGGEVLAVSNVGEAPWQRLAQRPTATGKAYLDEQQVKAAEHLRRTYERAHFSARVTANYDPAAAGHTHGGTSDNALLRLTDNNLAARHAVHRALEAVGPELSGLLLKVCCLENGLEEAERALDLPRRSGKAILAMGLSRLARHYGFKPALRHAGPEKIGHWGVVDYRPSIMPPTHAPHQP